MGFQRGFKTWASSVALGARNELGIGQFDALDPWLLADHLDIPVIGLSSLVGDAPAVEHLLTVEPEAFSAVTVFDGTRRIVVHNDSHAEVRQNSNICHELSHGLLNHPPTPALDDRGCRVWSQRIEDEATWLAGCLLVSEPATLAVARGTLSIAEAAVRLGVSRQMMQFRLNATGAIKRVSRAGAGRR
ncbi:ImmA/IrrE family metallo-endopeptidase [Ferrimicrobium sp.]|uniref:ImmA/IrrE family metallo-endopeptidase n=1 Tax=Ferrimicrobium sp. TaxID=2926050 RepID=UPI00261B8CE2|nr:ImmA/IrrE family metallo-endopeptidase [Ferrimicrobium sp.]